MNTLIVNTAFDNADYILLKDKEIFQIKTNANSKHSESSLVSVDKILSDANISIKEVDNFAVNIGPGSFTGVRIGVALIKGMLCALDNKNLIAFNSFEPLFCANKQLHYVCIKASNDDYYVAKKEISNNNEELMSFSILTNAEVESLENKLIFNNDYTHEMLIKLINSKLKNKKFSKVEDANPLYLKLSQAEKELMLKENINNVD